MSRVAALVARQASPLAAIAAAGRWRGFLLAITIMHETSELEATAYHESGHAFCAVRAGRPVAFARVGHSGHGLVRYLTRARLCFSHPCDAREQIGVCLAGPLAEAIFLHGAAAVDVRRPACGWDDASRDFELARHYARVVCRYARAQRDSVLSAVARETQQLLVANWPKVELIAAELLNPTNFGTLAGYEIARLMEQSHALGPLAGVL